jgi:hypothetical protein
MVDALKMTVGLDVDQATKNAGSFNDALYKAEKGGLSLGEAVAKGVKQASEELKAAEENAQAFTKILGGIGKIVTGAFGMVTVALKPAYDFGNYLGTLNQKVTQVGGALNSFQTSYFSFLDENTFKRGEGGFGLSGDEYKRIMMQFASGTTAVEKYGRAKEQNLKGFVGGAGMAEKVLGFSPEEASKSLTNLHKIVGLNFDAMEPFVKQMGAISKTANMSSKEFYNLTSQVTKLSKSYNLNGEAAKKYVLDSLTVGSAISQLGMDASTTIAKMNEVATGSEKGYIQSLLLGFKQNDPKGQLKAFQEQAKLIEGIAGDNPFLTKELAEGLEMPFDPADIHLLAGGGKPGEAGKRNPTDILEEIAKTLRGPESKKETPFVTPAQRANILANRIELGLIRVFTPAMNQLFDLVSTKIPHLITSIENLTKTFGEFSLGGLVAAALALAALPSIISGLVSGLVRGFISRAAIAVAPASVVGAETGLAALASACGNAAFAVGRLSLWAVALYEIFKSKKAGWDDKTNKGQDFYSPDETDVRKKAGLPLTGEGLNLKTTTGQGISPAMSGAGRPENNKGVSLDPSLDAFIKENKITPSKGMFNPDNHEPNSLHSKGLAFDYPVDIKDPKGIDKAVIIANKAQTAGLHVGNEIERPSGSTKWTGPHLHISNPNGVPGTLAQANVNNEKKGTAGSLAQANTGAAVSGGLQSVHDSAVYNAVMRLGDLIIGNNAGIRGDRLLSDSPTSNRSNEAAEAAWDRDNMAYGGG